ncbi:autotransporter outer membrane beta-barrel domain-containing protein [Pseudomonas anguilliseptica]|uniref:Outer membrane autotransporter barrel domain-containing protein n=1 Tax=Pseudomonas anguilliseptica TaxID=53406 RepID=A0A1H5IB92_PSEAG|nr:autotransporter outer membrane beta-barrel domain-containing protein [Pseudomonas anguilliseptica]SEE37450.1 outer membrane autotransporter barrel domain-containing protein [Pseudomonas anguilliseptica]
MRRPASPFLYLKKCALATAMTSLLLQPALSQAAAFSISNANASTGVINLSTSNLGNMVLGNPSALTSGANAYNYAVVYFVPNASNAAFAFGQNATPVDTVMIIYSGFFNPNTPGQGALAGNDDSGTADVCGISGLCPLVTLSVSGGQVYSVVISTFSPATSLGLPLSFFTNGDGVFYSAPPAATGGVFDSATQLHNSPALGAARVIDASPELLALFNTLSTAQQRSNAATQTLPLLLGATTNAISNSLSAINDVIQARQNSISGLSSGDPLLGSEHFWMKGFGSWADQNARNGIAGFDADSKGLALGVDAAVSEALTLGLAFAYAETNINSDSHAAPQDAQIDTFQLIGYGSYALSPETELNFQLDVGQNRTEGTRHMPFAGTAAESDYDGYSAHAGIGIGHRLRLSEQLTFVPSVRADYTWIGDDSYQEKGAGLLNLDVDSRNTEELVLGIDGKLDYALTETTLISANLGAGYDVINEGSSMTSAYAGAPGATFNAMGLDMEPWLARAGLGLTHTLDGGTEVSLRYDAEARSDFTNQSASIKARWAF